jgi:hypothetical protein
VAQRIPTQIGDVLILGTDKHYTAYTVWKISKAGQQDFDRQTTVKHVNQRAAAVAEARALVTPGRRIFLMNIDTGAWSDISSEN